jgi:hypothetical protein
LININNMKAKFLKIAGVKNEEQFYKKYPTEAAFFKAHPEAKKHINKAQLGDLLSNPPGEGYNWDPYMNQWVEGGMDYSQMQSKGSPATGVINTAGQFVGGLTSGGGGAASSTSNTKAKSGEQKPDIFGTMAQGLPLIGDIAGAIGDINQMKQQRKELERSAKVSDVALQASQTQPERKARRYVRPEDAVVSPNEVFIPGGTGTEILAEYGASIGGNPTEIQNMYNPGDLYSNLGYEPLEESDVIKQYRSGGYVPQAKGGMDFANFMSGGGGQAASSLIGAGFSQIGGGAAAGSQIGGAVGKGVGMFLGPIGSAIAQPIGQLLGGGVGAIVDAPGAKKQKRNIETIALQDSTRRTLGNYSSFGKNGGDIPYAEYGWVSHDWQPQVIAKWGDVDVQDVDGIFRPDDMKTLEHGGLLKAQGGMTLPYENYEERVNRFRDIMGKYSDEELNRRATTQAGLAEYAKLYPNEPFTQQDIGFFQDYTTQVLDPQTQAFMQRRGTDWKPGTERSKTDAIWGPKTQRQPFANVLMKRAGESDFTDLGTVRQGYGTSGTGGGGSSDMRGLIPGRINVGGKQVNVDVIEGKGYFKNPITGDTTVYDPSKYASESGKYGRMRTGGSIRQNYLSELDQFNFGGSLKTHWGGKAEVDSYNPYLPGTGETVMFKGNQHSESDGKGRTGIGVSYGSPEHDSYTDYAEYGSEQAHVEVENGEPGTQFTDANGDLSMTVFGALKIDKNAAMEIGDDEAKGLTYKKYVDRLNDKENKANKKLAKANEELEDLKVVTSYDRLKLNSLQSTIQGSDQKLKQLAILKTNAAGVQNAYNETADELGLDADALAKGKIKQSKDMGNAKHGKELKKAQPGVNIPTMSNFFRDRGFYLPEKVANIQPRLDSLVTSAGVFPQSLPPITTGYTSSAGSDGKKSSSSSKKKTTSTSKKKTSGKTKTDNKLSALIKQPKFTDADFVTPELIGDKPIEKSQLELLEEQGLGPSNWKKDINASAAASKTSNKKKDKTDWVDFAKALSTQLGPLLRRPLQEDLDVSQLYGEMIAKAQNQLEPVQAQTFQPLLDTPYDISLQDQLNQNQATFNDLKRMPGVSSNPAAMQALAAQKYSADKQVLADQFRANQAMRAGVFSKNRETLNNAALKNLAILDQQYVRQQEALSKTKATDLEIAKSISDKIAKNKLENRTFAAYSNMFPQYGFNRNMMAFSQAPTFFNKGQVPGLSPEDAKEFQEWYDQKLKKKEEEKKTTNTAKYGKELKKHFKNGNIVKSFKG